jgi:hypothetical protein
MDPSKTAQTTQQHDDTNQQVSCVPLINDTYMQFGSLTRHIFFERPATRCKR